MRHNDKKIFTSSGKNTSIQDHRKNYISDIKIFNINIKNINI